MLSPMRDNLDVQLNGRSIDLENLYITAYLSDPNRINNCKKHVATVYHTFTDLLDMSCKKHSAFYNIATHIVDKIFEIPDIGKGHT
jgi:hypothetical protein